MMWLRNPEQEQSPYQSVINNALSDETLMKLRAHITRYGLQAAETVSHKGQDETIRKTNICWISDLEELFHEVSNHVESVNNGKYNYALNYLEAVQYSKYPEGHHYDWHLDSSFKGNMGDARKLSYSILVNSEKEFEGGDLQLMTGPEEITIPLTQNQIVFFPSYILHRVTPVTKGIRKAVVGWVRGPDLV